MIIRGLREYNQAKIGPYKFSPFTIYMHDKQKQIIAEMQGDVFGKLIRINFFCVKEDYRKQGLGTKLIKTLENYAKQKQCQIIQLNTADFQTQYFHIK